MTAVARSPHWTTDFWALNYPMKGITSECCHCYYPKQKTEGSIYELRGKQPAFREQSSRGQAELNSGLLSLATCNFARRLHWLHRLCI